MKNQFITVLSIIMLLSMTFVGCTKIKEGYEGHKSFPSGFDGETQYYEGWHGILPWVSMIKYDLRQQTVEYNQAVIEKNGMEVGVSVAVSYRLIKGETGQLHMELGTSYEQKLIDPKAKGAVKDVVGRYTAEELYSTKREALEVEIEEILIGDFEGKHIELLFVEVADVDLPEQIEQAIVAKEAQEQSNLLAEKKQVEEYNLAQAKIAKAKGDSTALVINAAAQAEQIELINQQLARSPKYIEYIAATKWNGSFGEGNVFGEDIGLLKQLR